MQVSRDGISLHISYHVVAYDESWAGWGDNASRNFETEEEAVAYARKLRAGITPNGPQYEPIRVVKTIAMDSISVDIPF